MDVTLLTYMKLGFEQALVEASKVKAACRRMKGNFVLLWHNDLLYDKPLRELYRAILDC
jgi:hypothetical protein